MSCQAARRYVWRTCSNDATLGDSVSVITTIAFQVAVSVTSAVFNNVQLPAFVCIVFFQQPAGPKKPLCCVHEDELLWAADDLLTEEGNLTNASCGPYAQWPERYHGCEQWRIHTGGGGGGNCPPPPRVRVVSEEFFGNQFSQFVVIFLFKGLRNSSPITNLSPQDC